MLLLYWISWEKQLENPKKLNNLGISESQVVVVQQPKTLNMLFLYKIL